MSQSADTERPILRVSELNEGHSDDMAGSCGNPGPSPSQAGSCGNPNPPSNE